MRDGASQNAKPGSKGSGRWGKGKRGELRGWIFRKRRFVTG